MVGGTRVRAMGRCVPGVRFEGVRHAVTWAAMRPGPRTIRRWLLLAGALVAVGGLTAAHGYVERRGPSYVGAWWILDHAFDLFAAVGLLGVCLAVGRWVLRRAAPSTLDRPLEQLVFGTVLGTGVVALAILLLGVAGGLQPAALLLLLGGIALAARRELVGIPALLRAGAQYARAHAAGRGLGGVAVVALVLFAVFLLVFALAPPVDWDSLMYHLRVPAQFLERGRIYLPEDNLRVSYINVVHMLYLPLLAAGSSAGPAVLSALLALLLAVAVFSLGTRFFPGPTGTLSATLLWGTTTFLLVAITPRVDVSLALFTFLAHYALLAALETPADRRPLYVAGALLGLAVGVKYHALPYAVGLSPLILWAAYAPSRRVTAAVRPLALFGLAALAAALPWLLKNLWLLGAPIYPVLADPLLQPWLASLFGSRGVPDGVDPRILQIVWQSRSSFNLWDAFFAPGRISIEFEGNFYFTNPALWCLPVWAFFARERTLTWLVVPAVGYLLVLLLPFPDTNLRYLAPALVPLTVVVANVTVRVAERWLPRFARQTALAALALLALSPSARTAWMWARDTLAVEHALGLRSADEYRAAHLLPDARSHAALVRWVNAHVPGDARIVMLFEGRGFYFEPEVLQDHAASTWPLLATRPLDDCLREAGVTHVLLGVGAARYFVRGGADPAVLRWDRFESFAARCLDTLHESPGFVLFRIRAPGDTAAPAAPGPPPLTGSRSSAAAER